MYEHDIKKLMNYGSSLGITLDIPNDIEKNAMTITAWEASGRYDLHVVTKITTIKKYSRFQQIASDIVRCYFIAQKCREGNALQSLKLINQCHPVLSRIMLYASKSGTHWGNNGGKTILLFEVTNCDLKLRYKYYFY